MVSWTGKGINDMGNFGACETDDLEYVLLNVGIKDSPFVLFRLGICSPVECNSEKYYSDITSLVIQSAQGMAPPGTQIDAFITVPREINQQSMSTGGVVMICLIAFIVLLWIAGIIIAYTNIGNISYLENGVGSNSNIEDRKTRWALAFYSFNPIVNLQKLFTVKAGGDDSLAVFNGVRVLSICWVVVGHGFSLISLAPVKNFQTVNLLFEDRTFSIVPGGFYAVDSFFYLAGFLTFYLLTAKMYPKKGMIGI